MNNETPFWTLQNLEVPEFESETLETRTKLRTGEIGVLLLVALVTLAIQAAVAVGLLFDQVGLPHAAAAHALVVLLLAAFTFLPSRVDRRLHGTLTAGVALLGPFGAFGGLCTTFVYLAGLKGRISAAGWHALLFPASSLSRRERVRRDAHHLLKRARIDQGGDVAPMIDVMDRGDINERNQVVAFLTRNFEPRYVKALRKALGDPDPAIRAQAAGVAAGIDRRMSDDLRRRQADYDAKPDDPKRARALADQYDGYAHAGLLSATVVQDYRARAHQLYSDILARNPDDWETRVNHVRLLLRMNRPDEVAQLIAPYREQFEARTEWGAWLAEVYFETRQYTALRSLCARLRDAGQTATIPVSVRLALHEWARDV